MEDRRCKSPGCRNDDYCNNQATQKVNIGVFSRQDIGALPAQSVYHANAGDQVTFQNFQNFIQTTLKLILLIVKSYLNSKTIISNSSKQASLTVRTNEAFSSCLVRKGRDDIVAVTERDRAEQCGEMPGRTGGRVCVRITRGVPSCILAIERVEANMEGTWSLTIQREERGRNITRTADVELVMVELPDSVILQYGDETFRDTDRSPSLGKGSFNYHLPSNGLVD